MCGKFTSFCGFDYGTAGRICVFLTSPSYSRCGCLEVVFFDVSWSFFFKGAVARGADVFCVEGLSQLGFLFSYVEGFVRLIIRYFCRAFCEFFSFSLGVRVVDSVEGYERVGEARVDV